MDVPMFIHQVRNRGRIDIYIYACIVRESPAVRMVGVIKDLHRDAPKMNSRYLDRAVSDWKMIPPPKAKTKLTLALSLLHRTDRK